MIYQIYQHFHPKPEAIKSLSHEQQVALSEKAYNLYMAVREYVYIHSLHCERGYKLGNKTECMACKDLRKALNEA